MNRILFAYLIGVAAAIVLVAIGLGFDESAIAIAGVVIALAVGLLTIVPQLLAANGLRYAEHKEYFAGTLLPQAGGMTLVIGQGVVFVSQRRIAWKLQDNASPANPGYGETPLFDSMLRPHLRSGGTDSAWEDFATAFFNAETKVTSYTAARRAYDSAFCGKLDAMIQSIVGTAFHPVWRDARARDRTVSESRFAPRVYNADNFRTACELSYSGRFERDVGNRWEYHLPVAAAEDRAQGLPWRIKVGDGDGRDYIWGGPVPGDIGRIESELRSKLETLRDDPVLKDLFLKADAAEVAASDSLNQLPVLADHAAILLRHGPDIPGSCRYCADWSPRL